MKAQVTTLSSLRRDCDHGRVVSEGGGGGSLGACDRRAAKGVIETEEGCTSRDVGRLRQEGACWSLRLRYT